ncbi:MAG TPA: carbamoyl phosphate synthase small subunit, partial [Firmicutes bacterium]|nr:carbamoyl phosphate synthase small subunit [Bacillota bacterium]
MALARLVLEDGSEFIGEGFGDLHEVGGEVIFNTSIT